MLLDSTTRLEPYEIVSPIGAGGTGQVYRAWDARLARPVALKVLRADRLQTANPRVRLLREARAIAVLNHPNIVTVHDVGSVDGVDFIVMELVEGETLAGRLDRKPLPVGEVLRIAVDICAALAAAHAHGIIHCDLKPANVLLAKDQRVKVVDFGIARLLEPDDERTDTATVTIDGTDTRERLARGTAPYMSPEQVKGGHLDTRSDIFSFGALLYEMVSGRRAFEGATTVSTMAAVLAGDVTPLSEIAPGIPHNLERIVRRSLQKSPAARFQSADDLRFALEAVREDLAAAVVRPNPSSSRGPGAIVGWGETGWRRLRWTLAIVALLAASASVTWVRILPADDNTRLPVSRTTVTLPTGQELDTQLTAAPLALSPDGQRLAYVAHAEGRTGLNIRTLDSFEPTVIASTDGARYPFFSPDGQSVGFFADGKLKRISIHGGSPITICDVPIIGRGGTWGLDGTIVASSGSGLMRVPATGGRPEPVTSRDPGMDARRLHWPQFLPDGRTILVTVPYPPPSQLFALSLDTGTWRQLAEGSQAQYLSSGHLVFHAPSDQLRVVAFDVEQLAFRGEPSPVVAGVFRSEDGGGAYFAASRSGSLVFAPGGYARTLVRVERNGRRTILLDDRRGFRYPRLSPDGRFLAVAIDPRPSQLWIYDLARRSGMPLAAPGLISVWHPDGNRVIYSGFGGEMYWRVADASSEAHLLLARARQQYPNSWSKDGRTLIFNDDDSTNGLDIWQLPVGGDPGPLVATRARENWARLSPDGHWLAYTSDEFGRNDVHVRPFPNVDDGKWVVSTGGGVYPVWSPTGRELFYMNGTAMMSVPIQTTQGRFSAGAPERLFAGPFETGSPQFDVSPDGTYFVMVEADPDAKPTQMRLILNWSEELKHAATASP